MEEKMKFNCGEYSSKMLYPPIRLQCSVITREITVIMNCCIFWALSSILMKLDKQHFCYIGVVMYKLPELRLILRATLCMDMIELLCHGHFQIRYKFIIDLSSSHSSVCSVRFWYHIKINHKTKLFSYLPVLLRISLIILERLSSYLLIKWW